MKWHGRFLRLAMHVSEWSKDPNTRVGSVIVDEKRRVVGMGYNGFPRGILDSDKRLNDRETKYRYVVHAEANAILNARGSVEGCTLYCVEFPCQECVKLIIQSGIIRVVVNKVDQSNPQRWSENILTLEEAGIEVIR